MIKGQDLSFWDNPPWGDGKQKYRLGLTPISEDNWLNRKIGGSLHKHKKQLLDNRYHDVIAVTSSSSDAQNILKEHFKIEKRQYPDLIADMSLLIQDDLCLIRSNGDQELLAASVCSPSFSRMRAMSAFFPRFPGLTSIRSKLKSRGKRREYSLKP